MATYLLLLDFGEGWVDHTNKVILSDGFKIREAIGKDGVHEIQTCTFRLHNSLEISPLVFTSESDIKARLIRDGEEIFRGVIRPYASVEVIQKRMEPISLSILDESVLLEQYIFDSVVWSGCKVLDPSETEKSLLHKLFAEAGVESEEIITSVTIPEVIPWYKLEQGGYISDAIQDVCFEYGLQYRAFLDGSGFEIISIAHDEITIDHSLTAADIRDSLRVEKADNSQKGVIVEYSPTLYRSGTTVFEVDTTFEASLPAGGVFPVGADAEAYRQYYDISKIGDDAELLTSSNHVLEYEPITFSLVTVNESYESDYCRVFLRNNSGDDYSITKMRVIADIYYRGTASKAIVPGSNPKKHKAKVITTAGSAQKFALILSGRQNYGKQRYSFSSPRLLNVGRVARLQEMSVSSLDLVMLLSSREYDHVRDLYRYTAQGITPIDYMIPVSEIKISQAAGTKDGKDGEAAYQTEVISQNGTTFRMGQSFSTVLEVRVSQGGEDITEEFSDADFRWRRTSEDSYADSLWNSAHYSTGGKTITITQDDAVGRCAFFCDLLRKRS